MSIRNERETKAGGLNDRVEFRKITAHGQVPVRIYPYALKVVKANTNKYKSSIK